MGLLWLCVMIKCVHDIKSFWMSVTDFPQWARDTHATPHDLKRRRALNGILM